MNALQKNSLEEMKHLVDIYKKFNEFQTIVVIKGRIDQLNKIMEKDGANQIIKNANIFYKNGIAIRGLKFFSYGSNDAYQILADIYFRKMIIQTSLED